MVLPAFTFDDGKNGIAVTRSPLTAAIYRLVGLDTFPLARVSATPPIVASAQNESPEC
jgi:hypothetical protein